MKNIKLKDLLAESNKFSELEMKDKISDAFDTISFKKFGSLFRKHINPNFSQKINLAGGQIGGRTGMSWSELASYIIGDGTYIINQKQFDNFMKEYEKLKKL